MSVAGRPDPVRSCVGCRERRDRSRLVRVTSRHGEPIVDSSSDGRGAWLCRSVDGEYVADTACLTAAIDRRGFARAWRRDVSANEATAICDALRRRDDTAEHGEPDAH